MTARARSRSRSARNNLNTDAEGFKVIEKCRIALGDTFCPYNLDGCSSGTEQSGSHGDAVVVVAFDQAAAEYRPGDESGSSFDWLRRHRGQCGTPCQICANDCELVAIHPDGRIEASECHYCLDCQITYDDDRRCPPRVKRRKRQERDTAKTHAGVGDAEPRGSSQDGDPRRIPCLEEN